MALLPARRAVSAWADDEVRDLRVTKDPAGGVALSWVPPVTPPDSYIVRRCSLASLRGGPSGAPYFGNCIAQGLTSTTTTDPSPPFPAVFYLVSGSFAGTEGSLGVTDVISYTVPRTAPPCSMPEVSRPLWIIVSVPNGQRVCGTQVTLTYPLGDVTFVRSGCTGFLTAGCPSPGSPCFTQTIADRPVGELHHICLTDDADMGTTGRGDIVKFEFQRGDCPVGPSAFHLTQCLLSGGATNCDGSSLDEACQIREVLP